MANLKILSGLQQFISKIFSSSNNGQNGPGLFDGFMIGGNPVYPNANTERFVKDGYMGNGSVYTIIYKAHRKFGSIPRYVYKITDKKADRQLKALIRQKNFNLKRAMQLQIKAYDEMVVENKLSELLNQPNDFQGQDAFYELAYLFKLVTGNCFIALNRGDVQGLDDATIDALPPIEMYVLPTQYVEIIPDPANVWGVLGYKFNINGVRHYVRKNDMIHWKSQNPNFDGMSRAHQFGLSPLQPGNKFITEDDSATDAAVAMQQNDGAKGVIYRKDVGRLSPEQKSQVEMVINRRINNRSMKNAVAILEGEHGYFNLGQTGQEMELMDAREKGFVRLCNLIGVPPMLFLTNTTYDNVKQAEKTFITNLIAPDACNLRDEMNRVLLPALGLDSTYTHDIDISMLPELQDEMSQMITSLAAAWWLTPNQKLAQMNEEKSTDPLMDKIWVQNTMVLMDDAALSDTLDSFSDEPSNQPANNSNSGGATSDLPKGKHGKGN